MGFLLGLPRMALGLVFWFLIWIFTRPGGWLFGCIAVVLAVKMVPPQFWEYFQSPPSP